MQDTDFALLRLHGVESNSALRPLPSPEKAVCEYGVDLSGSGCVSADYCEQEFHKRR
jgi:hypothetical protein